MKKSFLIIICFLAGMNLMQGQSLDQYKYVQVPQRFEFLSEDNKFQLNALTAFLFEKYGFEVLYGEKIPATLEPCKLLKADVRKDKGLFNTKLYVELTDCRGDAVFTSKMGNSREKDYETAYQQALREAFTSFEELDYSYSEEAVIISAPPVSVSVDQNTSEELIPAKEQVIKAMPAGVEATIISDPAARFRNGNLEYSLKKLNAGFELYKIGEDNKFATLHESGSGKNYIYVSANVQGNAYFDEGGNLVVEYFDPASGQLVSLKYDKL